MSFWINRKLLLSLVMAAVLYPVAAAGADTADPFRGIWTEDLPNREQISKERLELIIRYVSEGKQSRQQQLRELYESDRGTFWTEVRAFFRANPPEAPGQSGDQGPVPRWKEDLQRQHEEFLAWLKEAYPDKEKELAHLRETNLDEYFRHFGGLYWKYGYIAATQKRNPELAAVLKEDLDLIDQRDDLLRRIRQADEKSKKRLTEDLHAVISKRFDLIVRKKQLQYGELRRRLERLRRDLENKEKELGKLIESKDAVTRQHLEKLLNPKPTVDWK